MRCEKIVGPVPQMSKGAVVQSVFKNSLNIELPEEVCMLTVHRFSDVELPGSFYVPDLSAARIEPGMPVSWNKKQLQIGGLTIPVRTGQTEEIQLQKCNRMEGTERLEECRRLLDKSRSKKTVEAFGSEQIYQCLHTQLSLFLRAVVKREEATAEAALKQCIGLGFGLTPSGDDMINGILGFFYVYQTEDFLWAKGLVERNLMRTTKVSASFLGWTCRGYASNLLKNVIYGLSEERQEETELFIHDVLRLMKVGHTSGGDLLEGILFAAEQHKKVYNAGKNQ